ncbi:MAG: 30S ribosomal protein S8 [Rickettsiales bacterium]|jgi:small subunit ribosomal protein S8|nr:30S ribosomal protein S8 [Rickettsiales bacterium]
MSFSDTIGDMLARIRNGAKARLASVTTPASRLRDGVLEVLRDEGFIAGFETYEVRKGVKETRIDLKYFEGESAFKEIKRVSTPGRRAYSEAKDIPHVKNGLGVAILSTSAGVIADHEARAKNVGGEVLCYVF